MPREILHGLTEQQAGVINPELEKLRELEKSVAEQKNRLLGIATLIRPEMKANPAVGFDLHTLQFYRTVEAPREQPSERLDSNTAGE